LNFVAVQTFELLMSNRCCLDIELLLSNCWCLNTHHIFNYI
jgi:hypothetical protein